MAKKKKINRKNAQLLRMLKFLIKFNIFAIPLYLILFTGATWPFLQRAVADMVMALLNFAGFHPSINDLLISIPIRNGSWAAVISWDCTGWKSMLAFFALVMATDFPLKRKLAGLVLLPAIFFINLLRVVFMFFYVRTFDLAYYQVVHAIIWSWGLIVAVLLLWIFWMQHDFTLKRKRHR